MGLRDMPSVAGKPVLGLPTLFDVATEKLDGDPPTLQILVGGRWRGAPSGETFDVASPIDGSVIARAQKANDNDIKSAIEAARDARSDFRAMPASERLEICRNAAELLEEHLDAFIEAVVLDLGKTRSQAKSEVSSTPSASSWCGRKCARSSASTFPATGSATHRARRGSCCESRLERWRRSDPSTIRCFCRPRRSFRR